MSLPRLKNCPNPACAHPTLVGVSYYIVRRVICEGCGMEGPMALDKGTKKEAIKLWNGLLRVTDATPLTKDE